MPEKLTSIFQVNPVALKELANWIEQAGVAIPVNQIVGFSSYQVQLSKETPNASATIGTTYQDIFTGPKLSGLRPGKYIFLFGCLVKGSNYTLYMALSYNGQTSSGQDEVSIPSSGVYLQEVGMTLNTFTQDENSVRTQFKILAPPGTTDGWIFIENWILGFKYA